MGIADPRSSGTRFECPEISVAPLARIARFETRADILRCGRAETSVCIGRYCHPGIAEMSLYSRLGRGLPLRETKNTKFRRRPLSNWRSNTCPKVGLVSPLNLHVYSVRRCPARHYSPRSHKSCFDQVTCQISFTLDAAIQKSKCLL